ncbi:MAG: methylmalonyl-CoA mutase family protein, partial [Pirellulaceae bacterium]|nr:methylmalonyl-CoA mutase family protein [Pirellulaceae bacterium]
MIDAADLVVLNKYDRRGSADALKAVRKQVRRSRLMFDPSVGDEELPVFGTIASRFNDDGVNAFYHALCQLLVQDTGRDWATSLDAPVGKVSSDRGAIIPPARIRYLAEIATRCRDHRRQAEQQARVARQLWQLREVQSDLGGNDDVERALRKRIRHWEDELTRESQTLLDDWDELTAAYCGDTYTYQVRGRDITVDLANESLSGSRIPKVALPRLEDPGAVLRWRMLENLPGHFPYTAGIYPFKRTQEDPKRQFAGEGPPEQTNRRLFLGHAGALVAGGLLASPLAARQRNRKANDVVAIGSRRELFLDDLLVESTRGKVDYQLHHPVPREQVIHHDQGWEGTSSGYHTVIQDGDLYRLYHRGFNFDLVNNQIRPTNSEVTCYAESSDGIHWVKPELGLHEHDGSKQNNIIWKGPGSHNFSPFLDQRPGCPASERMKAFGGLKRDGGMLLFKSADGIHWEKAHDKAVITNGAF